ncbi:18867_t:CDS:2, partial [Acaulospora morrowiae]
LTPEGVTLFENYVNNTADIQTASLAFSFCVPRRFSDQRVADWIESYRILLDKWKMFYCRAKFDIARGKKMNVAQATPAPQVYVRCTKCNQSIARSLFIPGTKGKTVLPTFSANPGTLFKSKATSCPVCQKSLPRCSICLLSLGTTNDALRDAIAANKRPRINNDSSPFGFDLWFTWCQTCRH